MDHQVRFWYDERFLARPWVATCLCGWYGCWPNQMETEEAIEYHKQRWAEAEAKLRRNDGFPEHIEKSPLRT